ncbi:MAG: ABC transporter permease [Propionibacteriaceae bacterium]|nr:ABC transporter permease [Propionibacteriaceae bacterium]
MLSLVTRIIRLYFCDKVAVFLSLLGAMIAIFLVLLFLKPTIVDSMTANFSGLVSSEQAGHVLDAWLIASACVIASCTSGLGALRQFIDDKETNRWRDVLVTPLPRWAITGGYLVAATAVSMLMTTTVLVLGTAYCLASAVPLSWSGVLAGWGWLMLCCAAFTAVMGLAVSGLRTLGAFTGLSVVIGVMFGFLSETYVTRSALSDPVGHILAWLPFAQASSLVRAPYTAEVVATLPDSVRAATIDAMTLTPDSLGWSWGVIVLVLVAMTLVCSLVAWQVMSRTVRR